jgi:glycosyltransferase involved in cell wall biosynthesis
MQKNILFILPFFPYPLKSGGHQAIFNGIKAICEEYNIFITYAIEKNDELLAEQAELSKILGQKITIIPYKKSPTNKKLSFLFRFYVKFWNTKEYLKKIFGFSKENKIPSLFKVTINDNKRIHFLNKLINTYNIDIVQCEMIPTISDVLILPPNIKKIYVQHQIDYIRNELDLQETNSFSKYKEEFLQSKQAEIFLLNHYDSIIALSEYDKSIMVQDGVSTPIHISPAIISTELVPFIEKPKKKTLSFIGPSSHYPNVNGIHWFLKNCWKKLKNLDPEYTLQIIGEWDIHNQKIIQKSFPDIEFCGFVPLLYPKIENTIMIVPINIGSGIRMKILEAISNGIPVVSTNIGVQGLPFENKIDCFITDNPKTFIEDILILKDINTQKRMVQNAQNKISTIYSIHFLKKTRLNIYKEIFQKK